MLADLVVAYEEKHVPMGDPSPVEVVKFCMIQRGLKPRDPVPLIGRRTKLEEVLSGKIRTTMPMAHTP